ncbi:MAG TPA: hypothetical protein VEH07_00235, partial [Alphaproteobacteria bacterium]|nr:hypothetical protein [Alphaproteobacteria bacterium]
MSLLAIPTAVHPQPLKRIHSHQAGKGTPRIEVISWDCDWSGKTAVKVHGEVKNLTGFILKDVRPYIVLRNQDHRSLAPTTKKTLDLRILPPSDKSTFRATIRLTDPAAVPKYCDVDFTDANGVFLPWRASHINEAEEAGYIGTAKMRRDGSIELRLYSTSNGADAHLFQVLHKGDKLYAEVISHVGGLKPGQTKLVP